ncbi:MAG: ABC transporter substrate-binding protein [Gammaproteobacteria bacterium]|nr:MAG: ABC transporter substrate-binding protein [Gammaproteobacteria bacterium]RTZ74415.1 MAG: ABC transporter substrate-binding protein [Gammaproteobacteria bacterium]
MRLCLLLFALLLTPPALAAKLPVAVSVLPQKTFVEAVGDGAVEVQVMVDKGFNPTTWQPTPRQLTRLTRTRLYVRAGVPFEKSWMQRFRTVNPGMEVLDMREGLDLIPLESGAGDPHVWTDPRMVKQHAARLRETLIRLDPEHRQTYETGYRDFAGELDALDAELAKKLAPLKGKHFLVFHPAWSYFARRYGLKQLSVEHEGKEPNAWSLARLIDRARALGIRTIIVQPQHSNATAKVVARALKGKLVEVDPLSEDYFGTLRRLADVLREAAS